MTTSTLPTAAPAEIATILRQVRTWPVAEQLHLARLILDRIDPATPTPLRGRGLSAEEVMERYRTDSPPPDDATVKQWTDEHRMEKYGK